MVILKIYLARHGETDWNIENRIQGQVDTELNEKGRQQAEELARKIAEGEYQIGSIYTSAKKRALETAWIAGNKLGMVPKVQQGLEEISFGKWEGYRWKQVRELFPEEYQVWRNNRRYQVPPEGESYQQLLDRLLPALSDIAKKEKVNALVVTHSAVIMTLLSYLYDTPFEDMAKNYKTGNAGVVELEGALFVH
ncbi:histidine phosphatase family protein [Parablautia intestinalis]|jgi:broad specificity phosphatase PhoE|uniref:Histidine phosphatase family protein n=1 Tax=Parablautia intestinalis TaxID=2320100 RepID=A0A3A9ALW0_9FIRM|nr:histidine phosphatase family protein [Parablautia intestinalis]MCI8614103.1 histidine phosphatase family protein [Lachnospiraceae bacterium]MDE7047289.1 histidine phosphatase family protein [Lachnospiraceae bacterium]RKI92432.1 histidine phosphatase family protein [Parablautia intestinalis]